MPPGALFVGKRDAACQGLLAFVVQPLHIVRMIYPRTKVRGHHLLQGETGVREHGLIRVRIAPIRSQDHDGLGDGIDDPSQLLFVLPDPLCRPLMRDGHHGQSSHLFKDIQVMRTWAAGLASVDREGAQHLAFGGHDRRGPAGAQAVRQGQMPILGPQRVHGDVRDHHRRGAVRGGDARTPGRAHGDAVDGVDVPLRQGGAAPCRR